MVDSQPITIVFYNIFLIVFFSRFAGRTTGIEPTGHYWMNLANFLDHYGITLVMVNPMHVKRSKELDDNLPTKNDKKDALVISRLLKEMKDLYCSQRQRKNF